MFAVLFPHAMLEHELDGVGSEDVEMQDHGSVPGIGVAGPSGWNR